jgi:hypothetical protein
MKNQPNSELPCQKFRPKPKSNIIGVMLEVTDYILEGFEKMIFKVILAAASKLDLMKCQTLYLW